MAVLNYSRRNKSSDPPLTIKDFEPYPESVPRYEALRQKILRIVALGLTAAGVGVLLVKGPDEWKKLNTEAVKPPQTPEEQVMKYVLASQYDQNNPPMVTKLNDAVFLLPKKQLEGENGEPIELQPGIFNPIILRTMDEGMMKVWIVSRDKTNKLRIFDTNEFTGFCAPNGTNPEMQTSALGYNNVHGTFAWSNTAYYRLSVEAMRGACARSVPSDEMTQAFEKAIVVRT